VLVTGKIGGLGAGPPGPTRHAHICPGCNNQLAAMKLQSAQCTSVANHKYLELGVKMDVWIFKHYYIKLN
jgi:hypothetical protein